MSKIGIIGAGNHARSNIYPCLKHLGADITAICTTKIESGERVNKMFGLNAELFDDVDAFLSSGTFDKVVVVLPADAAASVTLKCLEKGYEVFCEKPCGMSLKEAEEINDAQFEYDTGLQVGFMKRYAPIYRKLKEEKELGNLCSFTGYFNVDASAFCKDDKDYFYFVGIHYLDLIRYLFGETEDISVLKSSGNGMSYLLQMKMKDGVIGSLQLENRTAYTQECEGLKVTYENGYVETENLNRYTKHLSENTPEGWKGLNEKETSYFVSENPASGSYRDLYLRGFMGELESFMNNEVRPNKENLETTKLIEKILEELR